MISTITGKLIKIAMLALMCIAIAIVFSACGTGGFDNSFSDQNEPNEQTSENVVVFDGVSYITNSSLDFEVVDLEYDEDAGVTVIMFFSDDPMEIDYIDETYDFSSGPAQAIAFVYDAPYSEIINGNGNILGSYKIRYENAYSGYVDGWQIMYDENGEEIFKTDIFGILECGLHEYYYDKNDNVIASEYGWDSENESSLWIDKDGNILDEYELRTLLENMCPNEYLKNFI